MKVLRILGGAIAALLVAAPCANAQLGYQINSANSLYQQNFNTLPTSGTTNTSSSLPSEWGFAESGSGATVTYAADNGSSSTGNTYSYGTTGSMDRAFGLLDSSTVQPTIGADFVNNTGATIPTVLVAYTGEEWRLANAGSSDRLDFQFTTQPGATLLTGTYTNVDSLDFITPNETTTGAKDGNAAANRTVIPFVPFTVNLADGAVMYIRWQGSLAGGSLDDGLAVDDLQLLAVQPDADSDGVPDAADNCPTTYNPNPQSNIDGDGFGDVCDSDMDGDGVGNSPDNCDTIVNADQSDLDGDLAGDACDSDVDGDGVANSSDNCVRKANAGQADGDGDGSGDACDPLTVAAPPAAQTPAKKKCKKRRAATIAKKRCKKK